MDTNEFLSQFFESRLNLGMSEKAKLIMSQIRNLNKADIEGVVQTAKRSSTTVFAIKFRNGVIVAGDRRMSDGLYGIESDTEVKIKKLTEFSAMASSGWCNVIVEIERQMEQELKSFEKFYGPVRPDGQAKRLEHILSEWWFLFLIGIHFGIGIPVLAAYDTFYEKPRIFSFDVDSFCKEARFFAGIGCGFAEIQNLVIDYWKKNMTADQTVDLAVRALIHSGRASHGVSDAVIVPPTIAVIDKNGFRWIPKNEISEKVSAIYKTMEGLQCLLETNQ